MEELAIIIRNPDSTVKVLKIIGTGGIEFWEQNFKVACEAIDFQEQHSDLAHFNEVHLNLLLTQLIKQNVITRNGINLDPLIVKTVEKETARTAWRWSRKKKLMTAFEHKYMKSTGIIKRTLLNRFKAEWIQASWRWIFDRLPLPIQNLINFFKELSKRFDQ